MSDVKPLTVAAFRELHANGGIKNSGGLDEDLERARSGMLYRVADSWHYDCHVIADDERDAILTGSEGLTENPRGWDAKRVEIEAPTDEYVVTCNGVSKSIRASSCYEAVRWTPDVRPPRAPDVEYDVTVEHDGVVDRWRVSYVTRTGFRRVTE